MAVHAKRIVRGSGRVEFTVSAKDLLNPEHPLHAALKQFCGDKEITKRQATKFLQKYPQYREAKNG